jgi:hypothetical protein
MHTLGVQNVYKHSYYMVSIMVPLMNHKVCIMHHYVATTFTAAQNNIVTCYNM